VSHCFCINPVYSRRLPRLVAQITSNTAVIALATLLSVRNKMGRVVGTIAKTTISTSSRRMIKGGVS